MKNEYQEALNELNDCTISGFNKQKIQSLIDKHEKIKEALNKVISERINETGKVLEREEISYIQALQFVLKLLEMSTNE